MNTSTLDLDPALPAAVKHVTKYEDLRHPDLYKIKTAPSQMLGALMATQGHIYAGTVDPEEVKRRRKANRAARRARALRKRNARRRNRY